MIADCDGACVPAQYLGDKVCDTGARGANLKCAQHQMDNGDCTGALQNGPSNKNAPGGGFTKKLQDAHSGLSGKINSVTGQAQGSRLPDILIAGILLCFVARKYKQHRDMNGPPSWTKSQTKVKYQPVAGEDEEAALHGNRSDASDDVRDPPKVDYSQYASNFSPVETRDDKPETPASYSEYKQRRETSSSNPSPEKRQTNGSFWEQDAASGQKDEEDLEFD